MEERRLPGSYRNEVYFGLEESVPTFRVTAWVPPKRIRSLRNWWFHQWERLLLDYRKRHGHFPALLHAHSFVGGAAAQFLSRKYQIPYVLTEHYSGLVSGTVPRHWRKDLSRIYADAVQVIAVSRSLANNMQRYSREVIVIPNSINTRLFSPRASSVSNTPFQIINVGSLIPRKRQAMLLSAMSRLSNTYDIRLLIVGAGPLEQPLKKQIQALHLDPRVQLLGQQSQEELAVLYQSSHLFVSMSQSESFGLALAEAMACGLPVISTPTGIAESIVDTRSGRIVSGVEELVIAIQHYLTPVNEHRPDVARQKIVDRYGEEVVVQRIRDIYQKLLTL